MKVALILLVFVTFVISENSYPSRIEKDITELNGNEYHFTEKLLPYAASRGISKNDLICSLKVIAEKIEPDHNLWAKRYSGTGIAIWVCTLAKLGYEPAINTYRKLMRTRYADIDQDGCFRTLLECHVKDWYLLCDSVIKGKISVSEYSRWSLYTNYFKDIILKQYDSLQVKDSVAQLACLALRIEQSSSNALKADLLLINLAGNEYKYSIQRRNAIERYGKPEMMMKVNEVLYDDVNKWFKSVMSIPKEKLHNSPYFEKCGLTSGEKNR